VQHPTKRHKNSKPHGVTPGSQQVDFEPFDGASRFILIWLRTKHRMHVDRLEQSRVCIPVGDAASVAATSRGIPSSPRFNFGQPEGFSKKTPRKIPASRPPGFAYTDDLRPDTTCNWRARRRGFSLGSPALGIVTSHPAPPTKKFFWCCESPADARLGR
jgi:hypothetical protein